MSTAPELVIPLSAIGLAAGAIYRAGQLGGTVVTHAERLDKIEDAQLRNVTRGELDARFATIDAKIDMVLDILKEHNK